MTQILLKDIDVDGLSFLKTYESLGGYSSLKKAFSMKPEEVLNEVKSSGLRGRGGAGFPTGLKWSFLAKDSFPRYFACNADESEPGTCKDRILLQKNPHLLIEGLIVSSYACLIETGYIYFRGEFQDVADLMDRAIAESYDEGFLGKNILGSGFNFDLYTHLGAGAYICGEESALLNSLTGMRGDPRSKPPFPAVQGLYDKPTVINNVETVCAVPWIINEGSEAYKNIGTEKSTGTKLVSVSGHVNKPANVEIDLGTPISKIIEMTGGIRNGNKLKAFIPGGSSVPMLGADKVDIPYDYESLKEAGSMLGSGALIVMDETTNIVEATMRLAYFYMHESCGKCTPCREGTRWLYQMLGEVLNRRGSPETVKTLQDACDNMAMKTFCPLADAAVAPVVSSIDLFPEDYKSFFAEVAVTAS